MEPLNIKNYDAFMLYFEGIMDILNDVSSDIKAVYINIHMDGDVTPCVCGNALNYATEVIENPHFHSEVTFFLSPPSVRKEI
ncbi:hypothetical protein WJU16_18075 [Chitinophaga pollutisoli]|uniref:Uncharacterized protein n=1 Tax=Chitinophaga pollutisoli TaxID=3133966 RepID=A0ABZ2YJJ0_9BACT